MFRLKFWEKDHPSLEEWFRSFCQAAHEAQKRKYKLWQKHKKAKKPV